MVNYRGLYHNLCHNLATNLVRGVVELDPEKDTLFVLDNETLHTDGDFEQFDGTAVIRKASYVIVEINQAHGPIYDVYLSESSIYEVVEAKLREFIAITFAA